MLTHFVHSEERVSIEFVWLNYHLCLDCRKQIRVMLIVIKNYFSFGITPLFLKCPLISIFFE